MKELIVLIRHHLHPCPGFDKNSLRDHLYELVRNKSIKRADGHSKEHVENLERMVLLRILDDKWKDHINNLEQLRKELDIEKQVVGEHQQSSETHY